MIINPYVFTSNALLLDTYTNAAAAYSIRKLRTAYTGFCMNVRRTVGATSVFANVSFDSNNTVSFDSAISVTFGTSAATNLGEFAAKTGYSNPDGIAANQSIFMNIWYDQTTNARNMNQATNTRQPRLINAGTFELLTGSSTNRITLNSNYTNPSFVAIGTSFQAKTVFTVAKVDTQNTLNYVYGGTGAAFYNGTFTGVNGLGGYDGTNVRSLTGEDLLTHLGYFNLRSSKIYAARDGGAETDLGSFTLVNWVTTGLFGAGSGTTTTQTLRGLASEYVFFTNDESANLSAIRSNINTYYGIY